MLLLCKIIPEKVFGSTIGHNKGAYDALYPFLKHTHTHTRSMALFPALPGWAGTKKVKPI